MLLYLFISYAVQVSLFFALSHFGRCRVAGFVLTPTRRMLDEVNAMEQKIAKHKLALIKEQKKVFVVVVIVITFITVVACGYCKF